MIPADIWIDGRDWSDIEKCLYAHGVPEHEVTIWTGSRRTALRIVVDRMRNGSLIAEADHACVYGFDDAGDWRYEPEHGLLPIDYCELRPELSDPSELDAVCRGVLVARLVHDGHKTDMARRAADQLPWCYEQNGDPLAPDVEEYGWDNHARDLADFIAAEHRRPKSARDPWEGVTVVPIPERRNAGIVLAGKTPHYLDPKHFSVFHALWDSEGKSMSLEKLLREVWGTRPAGIHAQSLNKVRTCVSRINQKLMTEFIEVVIHRNENVRMRTVSLERIPKPGLE